MIHSFTELYHWASLAIMIFFYDVAKSWPSDKGFSLLINLALRFHENTLTIMTNYIVITFFTDHWKLFLSAFR